jgi:hypothetical protein
MRMARSYLQIEVTGTKGSLWVINVPYMYGDYIMSGGSITDELEKIWKEAVTI